MPGIDAHLPHTRPQDGYGVDMHQRLSVALLKRASELGDPEAQGQMGLRYSLGLQDPLSWGQDGVIGFEEVGALSVCGCVSPEGGGGHTGTWGKGDIRSELGQTT